MEWLSELTLPYRGTIYSVETRPPQAWQSHPTARSSGRFSAYRRMTAILATNGGNITPDSTAGRSCLPEIPQLRGSTRYKSAPQAQSKDTPLLGDAHVARMDEFMFYGRFNAVCKLSSRLCVGRHRSCTSHEHDRCGGGVS